MLSLIIFALCFLVGCAATVALLMPEAEAPAASEALSGTKAAG